MRVAATLACRVQSTRLYGKPLQLIDVEGNLTIIEYLIGSLKEHRLIDEIVLAIGEGLENEPFRRLAESLRLPYVIGPDWDVQQRLIMAATLVRADHVYRVTTECPFIYMDTFADTLARHVASDAALTVIEHLPEGSYYELIRLDQLRLAHELGQHHHRSELCTLYMFENPGRFLIQRLNPPNQQLCRPDLRLTVDYPEDLIVVRQLYGALRQSAEYIRLTSIIEYLDAHPQLKEVNGWIDAGKGRIWS
jgi:spore coat polysaccharide biosynthesis protein SpsF